MTRLALVVGVLGASRAWACSGLTCSSLVVPVPQSGSEIPSNAPAVGVQRTIFADVLIDGGIEYLPPTMAALQLRGPDGGFIVGPAVEPQLGVFVQTALSPGSWSMRLDDTNCGTDAGFTVGAAAPLPTAAATLSLVETTWAPAFEGFNSCYGPYSAQQVVRLRIEASPEMRPWLSLARWALELDGVEVMTSGFGRVKALPYDPSPLVPSPQLNVFTVGCGAVPDGGAVPRLQPGIHSARMVARILGVAGQIPSNALQLDVVCTPPVVIIDAGVDGGVDARVDADAGSAAGPGRQPSPAAQGGGCSSASGLGVLAVAFFWFRRRRLS